MLVLYCKLSNKSWINTEIITLFKQTNPDN